jgi:hypothetical protein
MPRRLLSGETKNAFSREFLMGKAGIERPWWLDPHEAATGTYE